MLKYKTKLDLV